MIGPVMTVVAFIAAAVYLAAGMPHHVADHLASTMLFSSLVLGILSAGALLVIARNDKEGRAWAFTIMASAAAFAIGSLAIAYS
jgi:cytochrome bd-type quinol oxidase subunit 2